MASLVDPAATKASYFLQYQLDWLADKKLIKMAKKSRRTGFSYTQAFEDVTDILNETEYTPGRKTKNVWFSSADESASKEYILYCAMWFEVYDAGARELGEVVIDSDHSIKALCIEAPNGGRIHALTSNPNRFRSKGGKVVLDEFAHHKDQQAMWKAAYASASIWGYAIRIISSDKGKGLFYEFCEDTKAGKTGWSLHIVTIHKAVEQGLLDKIRGRVTTAEERQNWLDEQRRNCRLEYIWLEEFCCIAQDSESAFFNHELISNCCRDGIRQNLVDVDEDMYAGWDIARVKDFAVIWTIGKRDREITRNIQAYEDTRFKIQKDFLRTLLCLSRFRRLCLDYTGMGIPLGEELQEEFGKYKVECVGFTNPVKEELAVDMKRAMEDRDFIMPDDPIVRASFHSIQKLVTTAGNVRFDAESTEQIGHADHFWAAALAHHAAKTARSGPLTIRSGVRRSIGRILHGYGLTR